MNGIDLTKVYSKVYQEDPICLDLVFKLGYAKEEKCEKVIDSLMNMYKDFNFIWF